ncbi:Purine nucleoside phosphoramidase [Buchnera aphidicola (Eriosoma lanigerum)]|uniref:histidine triad nucleotide-binding protein n=1 Tax=Buchnera aphidicola TaxID=9 RepID=UPI003464D23D
MFKKTIFHKIISGEIKSSIIYQDKYVTAIKDINPQAPIHILIIPNEYIPNSNYINKNNRQLFGYMFYIATKIAKKVHIDQDGYRIILNCNKNAGQEIYYLHIHLLGGKNLGPLLK